MTAQKVNALKWVEELMEATGCNEETAWREYDAMFNPQYSADDYDVPDYVDYAPDDYCGN